MDMALKDGSGTELMIMKCESLCIGMDRGFTCIRNKCIGYTTHMYIHNKC